MAAQVYYSPFIPAFNGNGAPVPGAKLYFFYTGTNNLAPVYADSDLMTSLGNPVSADLAGKFPNIYLNDSLVYRVRVTDPQGIPLGGDIDPYIPGTALQGPPGVPGGSNNTYATKALMKAASPTDGSYTVLAPTRQEYSYVAGDFSTLINDIDFIKLDNTSASVGALVVKRSDRSTFARFGAVGDGVTDDTAAVNAAAAWSKATKQPVYAIGSKGNTFSCLKVTIGAFCQIIGDHKRGSTIKARAYTTLPTGYFGLLEIEESTVIEVKLDDIRLDGNGGINPKQIGFYAFASPSTNPAVYQNGGLWYSTFYRFDILDFPGHSVWFRGGSNDLDANRNPISGQYSFLLPHQFLTFRDCHWIRGGDTGSTALCMTGQCGQFLFDACFIDGFNQSSGYNITMGREFVGGGREQGLLSGASLFAGAFVAPGFVQFRSLTTQASYCAILTDQSIATVDSAYFENLSRSIITYGGTIHVDNSTFQNAGNFNGNGFLLGAYDGGSFMGHGNVFGGATDAIWNMHNPNTGRVDVEMTGPYVAGKTIGTFTGTTPGNDGTLDLYRNKSLLVVGSLVPITNVTTGLLPGEYQNLLVVDQGVNACILQSSGTITVPGGRRVLRDGDTAIVTRFDGDQKFRFWISAAPLKGTAMPTTGYYEVGETVENISPPGTGTITLGWKRLTSGSNHVAGTDWRTIQGTGV